MKLISYLFIAIIALSACSQSAKPTNGNARPGSSKQQEAPRHADMLSLADAEKILGEPAQLTQDSTTYAKTIVRSQYAYKANIEDPKTHKTGAIYVLAEKYSGIPAAQEKYSTIKAANDNHEGVETLYNLGDEAYFHSDGENFYFIMARKGNYVLTMKVNKITSKTSLEEFNRVAKNIIDAS